MSLRRLLRSPELGAAPFAQVKEVQCLLDSSERLRIRRRRELALVAEVQKLADRGCELRANFLRVSNQSAEFCGGQFVRRQLEGLNEISSQDL